MFRFQATEHTAEPLWDKKKPLLDIYTNIWYI